MPLYAVPAHESEIRRDAVIVDTNVLVAAFCPDDQNHEDARRFVDEWPELFVVPIAVLIETWGMIVGSRKYWPGALELLLWIVTPGKAELLPQAATRFAQTSSMVSSTHVDCVDVLISHLADDISRQCEFAPPIRVATYDTKDLLMCRERKGLHLTILDMRSWEVY
jgi:predicted nucleic acid-binding protein